MKFEDDKIEAFLDNFDGVKSKIRSFKGCQKLELYRDQNDPTRFFTYSYWDSEQDLNAYRSSPMFEEVWKKTKSMFSERAQAWSLDKVRIV
jgi:heme-degrading monooxygenase HmoA